MTWGLESAAPDIIGESLAELGAATMAVEADLTDIDAPALIFDTTEHHLGPVTALVLCHCESVDSGLFDTSIESFDKHSPSTRVPPGC
ncbi:hypothetical protein [Nocardia terpenica]|uniref:hypothetical protein n=1 Tax=Nocardia terpenica TaxID=455432 RepID=UPI002FE17EA8